MGPNDKGKGKRLWAVLFGLLCLSSGCVSIYDDKVNVQRPEDVDIYQRNILDKCTPHTLPYRLVTGTMNVATTVLLGSPQASDQATFDFYWSQVTPDLATLAPGDTLKPTVNWDIQVVRFIPAILSNSCERVKAYGVETDCYQVSFPLYKYVSGTNCGPAANYPVFIFIYPKSNLPAYPVWLKTPYGTPTPGS